MTPLHAGALAAAISLAATPVVRRLAILVGATDRPGGRRVHERPTPRGGGVAVFAAGAATCALAPGTVHAVGAGVCAGFLLVLGAGIVDDFLSLRARTKLAAQIVAALLAVAGGARLSLLAGDTRLTLLDAALSALWIVLVINAFNLSDGLDGLAAGLGLIALGWLAVLGGGPSLPTAALAGALLGFLPWNLHPARIFLGDAGSLVVGYAVAVLPLAGHSGGTLPPLSLFLLVAVPAADLLLAVARRFCARCLPAWGEGLFWSGVVEGLRNTVRPDRRHIHHRLLDLGLRHTRAVLLLEAAAAGTAALGLVVARVHAWPVDLLALAGGVAVVAIVRALGFDELRPARSGLLLPIVRRLDRRPDVLLAADLVLSAAAYASALALTGHASAVGRASGAAVVVMALAEVAALAAMRAYRVAWETAGVGGLAFLLRASAAATMAGYVVLRLTGLPGGGAAALVHLALVVPAVALLRLAPSLVAQAARSASPPEPTLICGTTAEARHALARLRRTTGVRFAPMGFVELKPRWQGVHVYRLPVLGTLEALHDLLDEHRIRHLVVADSRLRGPSLDWVRAVCRQTDVQLHHYSEAIVPDEPSATLAVVQVAAGR